MLGQLIPSCKRLNYPKSSCIHLIFTFPLRLTTHKLYTIKHNVNTFGARKLASTLTKHPRMSIFVLIFLMEAFKRTMQDRLDQVMRPKQQARATQNHLLHLRLWIRHFSPPDSVIWAFSTTQNNSHKSQLLPVWRARTFSSVPDQTAAQRKGGHYIADQRLRVGKGWTITWG